MTTVTTTKGSALLGTHCDIEPGGGNYHLRLAGCDDCNLRELLSKSLEQVDDLYHQGYVRQPMFEAYMHLWATGATHYSSLGAGWAAEPTDPEVVELVLRFRKAIEARKAGAR
jgi:hypothetical protein